MSQEPEQSHPDSPSFVPSPHPDQPVSPPLEPTKPPVATPPSQASAKPARQSTASVLSSAILMIVGGALAAGGYGLARVFAPPQPPGEISGPAPADAVKPEDFKSLTGRVDELKSNFDQMNQLMKSRPDFAPELKMQRDNLDKLTRTVTEMSARFESIDQKLQTMSKIDSGNSSARVDDLDKKVGELSRSFNVLKGERRPPSSELANRGVEANLEGVAMEQAVELFNARKYSEARDAFAKLSAADPNDARIWYFSALSNGFSTGQWLGETERLVNLGLEKEKAGQPEATKINAIFATLTQATGKDWLATYRQRINAR